MKKLKQRILSMVRQARRENYFVLIWFLGTFLVVLPLLCRDMVFSAYFRADRNDPRFFRVVQDRNEARFKESRTYLSGIMKTSQVIQPDDVAHHLNITIGIITMTRSSDNAQSTGYLTQTVAALHRQISAGSEILGETNIYICNVDSNVSQEIIDLKQILPVISKYDLQTSKSKLSSKSSYIREYEDYSFCLDNALKSSRRAQYIMMVQDDAVPRENFFRILQDMINETKRIKIIHGERIPSRPLGSIKLYYPPKWSGFSYYGFRHIIEIVQFGVIGGTFFCFVLTTFANYLSFSKSRIMSLRLRFLVGAIYMMMLVHMIGRPYVLDWLGNWSYFYHLSPGHGCCIPAVVYPTSVTRELVPYLRNTTADRRRTTHVDIALEQFMTQHHLESFNVEPNLVRHIGMVSTLNNKAKKPAEFIHIL